MIELSINNKLYKIVVDSEMPLLWVLRDILNLTGSKYGCGLGLCGACTVHVDKKSIRSCITPAASLEGKKITTIEGLSKDGNHPIQRLWKDFDVSQCGYCQSGQIMTATALFANNPNPSEEELTNTMSNHLCRCGTYSRIRKAMLHFKNENNSL